MSRLIFILLLALSFSSNAADKETLKSLWGAVKEKAAERVDEFKQRHTAEPSVSVQAESGTPHPSQWIDYGFFYVDYNCYHRGFNYLRYETVPDQGSIKRHEPFYDEPSLDADCPGQKTTRSYKKRFGQEQYHRGHGTHQNIWDHNEEWMATTNRMTNVVPHHGVLNSRGLWRSLETRVECARDETTVTVYLGNNWGNDTTNDHFVKSHGVTTPDYLWRVHVYQSHPNQAFVWYMPNSAEPGAKDFDKYRVTLAELRSVTKDDFSWPLPPQWVDAQGRDPYRHTTCSWK